VELGVILKTGLVFLGVIGLIVLIAQLLRRWQAKGGLSFLAPSTGNLRLLDQLTLDHQRRVVIVRDNHQEYVLLLGTHNDTVLATRLMGETKNHG
jgi:flagellar biogenesis protein FliO